MHCTGPDNIILQFAGDLNNEFKQKMYSLYELLLTHTDSKPPVYTPRAVGEYVCAPFEDSPYRAEVKAIHTQARTATLMFIDFGNVTEV